MVKILRHDEYKYPKSKITANFPRPPPVRLEVIEDQDLESARELVEREAEMSIRLLAENSEDQNDRRSLHFSSFPFTS